MELDQLTPDEQLALLALILQMIDAEKGRSPEEMREFRAIANDMGRRAFDEAMKAALAQSTSREAALALARTHLVRPDARELAHTVLVDLAAADFVSDDERDLVREVAAALDVKTRL